MENDALRMINEFRDKINIKSKTVENSTDEKIIISERNRDGAKIWLERIDNTNEYIIKTNKNFVLEYSRIIFDSIPDDALIFDFNWDGKKTLCRAFDPSGGPYISVGSNINEKYKLVRIYRDYNNNQLKFVINNI